MAEKKYKYDFGDLGVGKTLDVAGNILRNRFWDLAKICLFFFVPAYLLTNLAIYFIFPEGSPLAAIQNVFSSIENPELLVRQRVESSSVLLNLLITLMQVLVVLPLTRAAVCRLVAYEYLGREQKPHKSFSWALRKYWRLLGANILFMLILGASGIIMGFAFKMIAESSRFIGNGLGQAIVMGLLFLVLLIGGLFLYIYVYLRFCLFLVPIVVEDCPAGKSIGRSSALTKGRLSRFFWVLTVTWIISSFVIGGAYSIPGGWITMAVVSLVAAIPEVFSCCVQVVFYFNCRCVHENLDIVMLSESVKKLDEPKPEHRSVDGSGSSMGTEYV